MKVFKEIFKTVGEQSGLKIKTLVLPPIRAHSHFKEGKADAIFPAFEEEMSDSFNRSLCFAKKMDYLFYLKGRPPAKVMLENKYKIAVVRGYFHPSKTLKNFSKSLFTVDSAEAGMRMLVSKRVDLFLVDNISAVTSLLLKDFPEIRFNSKEPIDETCSFFWARKDLYGQKFIKALDSIIKSKDLSRFFINGFLEKVRELENKRLHSSPEN